MPLRGLMFSRILVCPTISWVLWTPQQCTFPSYPSSEKIKAIVVLLTYCLNPTSPGVLAVKIVDLIIIYPSYKELFLSSFHVFWDSLYYKRQTCSVEFSTPITAKIKNALHLIPDILNHLRINVMSK